MNKRIRYVQLFAGALVLTITSAVIGTVMPWAMLLMPAMAGAVWLIVDAIPHLRD